MLGSPNVGKTTLIDVAIYGNLSRLTKDYEPTIEDIYTALIEYDRNLREKLFIYDYSGQIDPINIDSIKFYLSFCDAFILVFAINDKESFLMAAQIKKCIDKLREKREIPIVMIANKIDKINESAVNLDEIRKWTAQEKLKYYELKSLDRKSISECLINLTSKLVMHSKTSSSSFSRKSKTHSLQLEL
ncbi:hypothetical protein NH340_JMT05102 [Sarcoptes scabiei]|nr:hypothetical protein NH340_JMT05102 [Sarcoptes scabiei]